MHIHLVDAANADAKRNATQTGKNLMSYASIHRQAVRESLKAQQDARIAELQQHTHAVVWELDKRSCFTGSLTECAQYIGKDRYLAIVPFTDKMRKPMITAVKQWLPTY